MEYIYATSLTKLGRRDSSKTQLVCLGQLHFIILTAQQMKLSQTHKLHILGEVKLAGLLVNFTEASIEVLHLIHSASHVPPNTYLPIEL
jgi:hypothetical protein